MLLVVAMALVGCASPFSPSTAEAPPQAIGDHGTAPAPALSDEADEASWEGLPLEEAKTAELAPGEPAPDAKPALAVAPESRSREGSLAKGETPPPSPHDDARRQKQKDTHPKSPAAYKPSRAEIGSGIAPAPSPMPTFNTEAYQALPDNDFIAVADDPRSTFSIDVDTASYSNMRRFLLDGTLPPPDAVRIEELINYFDYDYPRPTDGKPFSVAAEVGECPWEASHRVVHVGIQGKEIHHAQVPARNLVLLLDVSGSMESPDKLPLLRRAFGMLADTLRPQDQVSIVVYAGASGVVLPPTSGRDKSTILAALDQLSAGGSTNGGEGIHAAYAMARQAFVQGGINRVILATDGDFNVGTTSEGELVRLIEEQRKSGVFLSVLGFGRGNLNDAMMEQIADKGNGNYAYIDTVAEAHKVLVEQAGATLVTIAKDVKIQVEFNPAEVASYRLIGYVNRKLAHADFNDDKKDAGEIGAGHTVTALYEVVPSHVAVPTGVDALRYQKATSLSPEAFGGDLMNVKIRYKAPDGDQSTLISFPIRDSDRNLAATSETFRFSAAVAGFGMLLRGSPHKGNANYPAMRTLAESARGSDPHGRRRELISLIDRAAQLSGVAAYDRTK